MKQKNLILIVVAVVCGLVAAVLTSRMSAGGTKQKVEDFVEVPVAAKDIPIGTKIPAKDVEQYFTKKKFPKDALPPAYVADTQDVVDKRTMRPIRMGETINPADISATGFLAPPPGHVLLTAPITLEHGASGFALPGARVTVIATVKSHRMNKDIVFPLFLDVLILAVDTNPAPPQANPQNGGGQQGGGGGASAAGFQQMRMMSFAVTPEDSLLLSQASDTATLRIAMANQDEKEKAAVIEGYTKLRPSPDEIRRIFADEITPGLSGPQAGSSDGPRVETVKVKVPTEAIESGTLISEEVLEKKFKVIDYPKEFLPAKVATEDKDLLDRYATADLIPQLLTPAAHLAKTAPKKPDNPVIGSGVIAVAKADAPENDVSTPKGQTDGLPTPPKKEYVYVNVVTAQGKKTFKYEVKKDGSKELVGEVTPGLDENEPK
jgi:Flp pilus assembly protein CpaB